MRAAAMMVAVVLAMSWAVAANAARSQKIKDDGKAKKGAVAGMRAYSPEQIAAYNRGVTALDLRDYAQARKSFEVALQLNDEFPEAHNNLAYTLRSISLDNSELSLKHYARALELSPKFAQALYYRGVLYIQLSRAADAEKDRAALLAIDTSVSKNFAVELGKVIKAGIAKEPQAALSAYGVLTP